MGGLAPDLRARVEAWIAQDPDLETREELENLLAMGAHEALADRFAGRIAFGTAGLRGAMAGGPTRMNRLVVRQSAAGIARYLLSAVEGAARNGVLVAHDARHRSATFAIDCADVLAAQGIRVILAPDPVPTPVGVFAIRHLGCAAGIVVTASHNPPADNGLKLYLGDGAQIVPPVDDLVAAQIDAVAAEGPAASECANWRRPRTPIGASEPGADQAGITRASDDFVPREIDAAAAEGGTAPECATWRRPRTPSGASEPLAPEVLDAYRAATLARVPRPVAAIRIATSALHGVGGALLAELLASAGHRVVHPVPEQEVPDPDFPTVAFPNPEEPGVTDLLAARMVAVDADIGLALDPDADRVAVLVPVAEGRPRQLTGDDVGALLGDWLLGSATSGPDRLVVSSVVSSSLLARVAEAHGARHVETLTGFKWLSRPAMEHPELVQVLVYEEAIGYAIGAEVRDKDGLSAALAVASMASAATATGRTLTDELDRLHTLHGAHVTDNFSLRDEAPGGAERRAALVERLIASPPSRVGGLDTTTIRALASDVLRIDLTGRVRVIVRPSGTEPKLKCYCEAVEPVPDGNLSAARDRARARLADVRAGLTDLLLG